MNRLQFLSKTLPVNLAENKDHAGVEFLVLDYNSGDNMEAWVRDNMSEYLESGLLKYYKTYDPVYFHLGHSKNMIMRMATGEIIGMVDADNFAGPGYTRWVEETFRVNGPNSITTTLRKDSIPYRDQGGKLCFSKDLFHAVKGFDEELIGYGMDDVDLANRLENAGGKRVFLEEEKYLLYIGHSENERVKNYRYTNLLSNIYYKMTDSSGSGNLRTLYLFKDGTFSDMNYKFRENLKTNLVLTYHGWIVERQDGRKDGRFTQSDGMLSLLYEDGSVSKYSGYDKGLLQSVMEKDTIWKEVRKDEGMYITAVYAYGECQNRLRSVENERDPNRINEGGWGRGTVYLNFDRSRPIELR